MAARKWMRVLCIILAAAMCMGLLSLSVFSANGIYLDTKDHWAKDAISYWTQKKVIEGVGLDLFKPDDLLTRADTCVIISRFLRLPTQEDPMVIFSDVPTGRYYTAHIAAASDYGVIAGFPDGTFAPMDTLTREQAMVIVARALCLAPIEDTSILAETFPDPDSVSDWAAGYVAALVEHDIVHGTLKGLEGQLICTRAMLVQMLREFVGLYIDAPGTYDVSDLKEGQVIVITVPGVKLTGNVNHRILLTEGAAGASMDFSGAKVKNGIYVRGSNISMTNVGCGSDIFTIATARGTLTNNVKVPPDTHYVVPCGTGVGAGCGPNCVCNHGEHCGCSGGSGGSGSGTTPVKPVDSLTWWDNKEGIPFDFSEHLMLPGDQASREYDLSATARRGGNVIFGISIKNGSSRFLADKLDCTVILNGEEVYNGKLSACTGISIPVQGKNVKLNYLVTVTLPTDATLKYQGLRVEADFNWMLEVGR